MVKLLHAAELAAIKAELQAKRGALLQTMHDMQDHTFKASSLLSTPVSPHRTSARSISS